MDQLTAHLDRGWDLVSRGELDGALVSAEKSLELDGESPEAHNLLGYVQAARGETEAALDAYRKAVDLDDTFVEAMLNAAELLMHPVHDYEGAIALVEDAIDLMEDDEELADAMLLKLDALAGMGDADGMSRVAAALPEGPFENAALELHVGRAKLDAGELEPAERHIRAALERDPESADAHYFLALLLDTMGDHHAAAVEFLASRERDLRAPVPSWSLPPDQFERRVEAALRSLPPVLCSALEGALVVVGDVPGAEVVADHVDPRAAVLLDQIAVDSTPPRVGRVFVYQQNIERTLRSPLEIEEEIATALTHELASAFPSLADAVMAEVPAEATSSGGEPD